MYTNFLNQKLPDLFCEAGGFFQHYKIMKTLQLYAKNPYKKGIINFDNCDYNLAIVPLKVNPSARYQPTHQLIYKHPGSIFDNERLSGLFIVTPNVSNFWKGSFTVNSKKVYFTVKLEGEYAIIKKKVTKKPKDV